jgi:hypothetical protein
MWGNEGGVDHFLKNKIYNQVLLYSIHGSKRSDKTKAHNKGDCHNLDLSIKS